VDDRGGIAGILVDAPRQGVDSFRLGPPVPDGTEETNEPFIHLSPSRRRRRKNRQPPVRPKPSSRVM
jgi:hypothetical protein